MPRAASLAEAIVAAFRPVVGQQHPVEEIVLIPSAGGRYEITVDGELVYSKAATGRHIADDAAVSLIRERWSSSSG